MMQKKYKPTRKVTWTVPESYSRKPKDSSLIYCPQCCRPKLQFKTKKSADLHILLNSSEIYRENGKSPVRSYWCSDCCCYHTTSKSNQIVENDPDKMEILGYLAAAIVNPGDQEMYIRKAYNKLLDNQDKIWTQEVARKILDFKERKE